MKKILVSLCLLAISHFLQAQGFSRYIIQFKNKQGSVYNVSSPLQYLSQRAVDRRIRYGVPIDSTDFPVTPRYLDSVRLSGNVTLLNASRWLNQVSIQTTDAAALARINSFSFVESVSPIAARLAGGSTSGMKGLISKGKQNRILPPSSRQNIRGVRKTAADYYAYGQSYTQIHLHNGEFLHNIGLRGQGMTIGVLDGGFFRYTSLPAFDSVNAAGQILGTYDFVDRQTSVVEDDSHGMSCLSVIAANIPGQFVGAAPKASFYLFRSEEATSEYPIEEHNWVCAAERVDSAGGDVISSSLGYSDRMDNAVFDHTYAQMNGNITIAARGADMAAKKGILVVNAAGNDGNGSFHYISTPADGDSVMAVGAVRSDSVAAGFSSYGPSSDNQVKPDVASLGAPGTIQTSSGNIGSSNGTSFACPNIAGLATCLWQGFPEVSNIRILNVLRQAGHKAASPDNRVGYGIPDMKTAILFLLKEFSTANASTTGCRTTVSWTCKDLGTMKYEIERRTPTQGTFVKVGERQASGASFAARSYIFADSLINVPAGVVSYRIRQIIDTAMATSRADYIDTVSVTAGGGCIATAVLPVAPTTDEIVLLPNPAQERVTLQMTTQTAIPTLLIQLVNAKGQIIRTENRSKAAGTATFHLPLAGLASGRYFISVFAKQKLIATKELLKL